LEERCEKTEGPQEGGTVLGFCGINCSECDAYKATITADEKLIQRAVDTYGEGKGSWIDWICLGCQHPERRLIATGCAKCQIRACALEHAISSCAACPDYDGCEKLFSFIQEEEHGEGGDVLVRKMKWLREAFVARRHDGV